MSCWYAHNILGKEKTRSKTRSFNDIRHVVTLFKKTPHVLFLLFSWNYLRYKECKEKKSKEYTHNAILTLGNHNQDGQIITSTCFYLLVTTSRHIPLIAIIVSKYIHICRGQSVSQEGQGVLTNASITLMTVLSLL